MRVWFPRLHTTTHTTHTHTHTHRAAKRIGGAQGKYKKWGPTKWIVRGVWGQAPRKF